MPEPVVTGQRHVVIHGHFYQPPRENPWIEEIEVQDSAAPYHDWNARITAECYGPNTAARVVQPGGGVTDIINNFAKISFNVGPTLMAYLERNAPAVYKKILEADRVSAGERGHGNAIAQAYNHAILPLASARDRRTQIRWGIRDFEHRFGRHPRGMWLPECAADEDTLLALVDEGISFTILAPGQARRFRGGHGGAWHAGIDPRRAYRAELPGGRGLALFFYDGGVAHEIAFGEGLRDRDAFVDRLLAAFGDAGPGAWLVNVATDGETFGHHRPFGDMVLAAAIERIERERPAQLTNYARFLELHPPEHTVEIVSPSSWSCAHGVRRWQDDCGCTTGGEPGWHQRWRRPLREAFDDLRDRLADLFERRGAEFLVSPWTARDEYVRVLLDRTPERLDAFLAEHLRPGADVTAALKLLEAQRHALLMYTSCGWFFGELSGPETVQVLRYASRAIQLAQEIDGVDHELGRGIATAFGLALARAPSNLPGEGDGARVLEQRVRPSLATLSSVVAHYALSILFEPYPTKGRIFCYRYEADEVIRRSRGSTQLAVGQVRLGSEVTRETVAATFAMLHFGGHDVRCAVGVLADPAHLEELKVQLTFLFERASVGDVVRAIDRHFPGREYGLSDLFLDERRKVVKVIVGDILERHRHELQSVFEATRPLLRFLASADTPVPRPLAAAADYSLSLRFTQLVGEAEVGTARFEGATGEFLWLRDEARALGASLDVASARRVLETRILDEALALSVAARRDTARALLAYLDLAGALELGPDVWEAQNLFWTLTLDPPRGPDVDGELMVRLGVRLGFDERTIEAAWRDGALAVMNGSHDG